jgi:phosphatidate cytidylyltransferase
MKTIYVRVNTGLIGGMLFFGLYYYIPSLFICMLVSLAVWMAAVEWPRVQGITAGAYDAVTFWYQIPTLSTLLYPATPLVLLIIHVAVWRSAAPLYALYPFIAAWIVDAAAYTVGSVWGRHRCFPTISPHKTWEGIIGGVAALLMVHMLMWLSGATELAWWVMLLGAGVVAAAAIAGDVLVSWFKRQQGLKDTGALLPGHGGLLDRFDSVLGVIVVVSLFDVLLYW